MAGASVGGLLFFAKQMHYLNVSSSIENSLGWIEGRHLICARRLDELKDGWRQVLALLRRKAFGS